MAASPYEHNLYQFNHATDIYNIAPGTSASVCNYINGLQNVIHITDQGLKASISDFSGKKPYSIERLSFFSEIYGAPSLSIVLTSLYLEKDFYSINQNKKVAVITAYSYAKELGIKVLHYFVYFTSLALLEYYIPDLHRHSGITDCPFSDKPNNLKLMDMIKRGHLCSECEESIKNFMDSGPHDSILLDAIRKILNSLAQYYQGKSKNIIIDANRNIIFNGTKDRASQDADIKLSFKAETGRYHVAHDDKAPKDALGHMDYADAISDIIMDENTETPLTIGIGGPWGRGKTVLLNFIRRKLETQYNDKSQCIEFNAWKYSKAEQLWAEFYTKIIDDIASGLSKWDKFRFRWDYLIKTHKSFFQFLGISVILLTLILVLVIIFADIDLISLIIYICILLTGGVSIISYGIHLLSLSIQIFSKSKRKSFKTTLGVQHEIFKNLDIACDWIIREYKKRVIVIIDDIDRCSPNKILQILESLKHFLEIENFIFLLGLDARVVIPAIGKHYDFIAKNKYERECMGQSYLDKIIQVPFCLPQPNPRELMMMASEILIKYKESEPSLTPETPEEMDEPIIKADVPPNRPEITPSGPKNNQPYVIVNGRTDSIVRLNKNEFKILQEVINTYQFNLSPRLLKRFINIYLIARHIYIRSQEKENNAANLPPGSLMKWLALSVQYPFETAALVKWFEASEWDNPVHPVGNEDQPLFDDIAGEFLLLETSSTDNEKRPKLGSPFENMDINRLNEFGEIYSRMGINVDDLKDTRHISALFNLVLD